MAWKLSTRRTNMERSFYNAVLTETFEELERFFAEFVAKYKRGYLLLKLGSSGLRLSHYGKLSYCLEDISHSIDGLEDKFYHIAVYKVSERDGNFNVVRVFYIEDEQLYMLKTAVDGAVLEKFYGVLDETYVKDLCKIREKFRNWTV